jgi:hypothetical protein
VTTVAPPSSLFLKRLKHALLEDFQDELTTACRYAVMRTLGYAAIDCRRALALGTGDARQIEALGGPFQALLARRPGSCPTRRWGGRGRAAA